MITLQQERKEGFDAIIDNIYINEIIFIGLIFLCFIGDVIGEISEHAVIIYWLLMTPIFFLSSVIIEKAQIAQNEKQSQLHLYFGLSFWCSAFLAVLLILLLWHAGAFAAQTVGFIIHVILAHTMFISGTILGLRFYLIGLFLFITAGFTIAMEGTVAMTLILAIPLSLIGLYFEKNYFFPQIKRIHKELKESKSNFNFLDIYSVLNNRG